MAYPGDFVAANRAARTDAQRAVIRRVSDLRRACFRVREWLAKRIPRAFTHAARIGFTRDSEGGFSSKLLSSEGGRNDRFSRRTC
jgi:hypothetical protein